MIILEPCFFKVQFSIDLAPAKRNERCEPEVRKLSLCPGAVLSVTSAGLVFRVTSEVGLA